LAWWRPNSPPALAIAASALSVVLIGCAATPEDPTAGYASFLKPGVGIDSPIRDLLNNPATSAVLQKDMPGMVDDPRLDMVKSMTLRQIAQFPQAGLDDAKLRSIQADLLATTVAPRTQAAAKLTAVAAIKD
jgi:hypothetical protein